MKKRPVKKRSPIARAVTHLHRSPHPDKTKYNRKKEKANDYISRSVQDNTTKDDA